MPIGNELLVALIEIIVEINLILFVFNIIPLPQLDGSRVIFPFLPRSLQNFYARAEAFGMIIALLFVIVAFPLVFTIVNFLFTLITGQRLV